MTGAEVVVGINGYGRIGRAFHRLSLLDPAIRVAAVNNRSDADTLGHLLAYDSVYGELDADVVARESGFSVAGQSIQVYQEAAPESIPWDRHNIDVVIDATGKFKDRDSLDAHLNGSVQYVILCCPPKDDRIPSVVMGVNHGLVNPASESIISNASCTTNALTPLIHILDEAFGLEFCSFRTIHALTDSQHLLDNSDKDPRRARAAMESIIPTSTGAPSPASSSPIKARIFALIDSPSGLLSVALASGVAAGAISLALIITSAGFTSVCGVEIGVAPSDCCCAENLAVPLLVPSARGGISPSSSRCATSQFGLSIARMISGER